MSAAPSSSNGSVLVVFPFCLDHVGHGNIQRLLGIARYFSASGYDVDLAYQGSPRVARVDEQYATFRRVFGVEGGVRSSDEGACARRLTAFYSGHELPATHMRPSAPLTTLVRSLLEAESYRAAIATYAFTAPIFAGLGRRVLTVCDVQDILHEHADACQRATGQSTSFSLPAATEAFLWRQWDVLLAITPEDKARIRRDILPHQHLMSVRHAATAFASTPAAGADDVALYAGSDNVSNVQAMTWLLDEVWPRVIRARPSARLRIAGLICNALPESARSTPGIEILGFRKDISDEIVNCGVLVAPYLYGSGLKIKVVEAACGGKAILTTDAGLIGTGLEPGRALEVHDDAPAFADALVGLLGDRGRRESTAAIALAQARELFSPEACYSPITFAIQLFGTSATARTGHALAPAVLDRIQIVVSHVKPRRLILWGNGAHTRALVAALHNIAIPVGLIVDGRLEVARTSPEGLPVVPASQLGFTPGDLVVLSSETFEPEMWRDLAAYRDAGGHVLGLCDPRYVSRDLIDRLSSSVRVELGASPVEARRDGAPPAIVLWDSRATSSRWWRLCVLSDLAGAAHRLGTTALVAAPMRLAREAAALADMPSSANVAPVLELDGRMLEDLDPDGGARGLARLSDLVARASSHAAALLTLKHDDVLVVMWPSLSECFGLAQALKDVGHAHCPSVVVCAAASGDDARALDLSDGDWCAYWRLAINAIADAADGRLAVVATEAGAAEALRARLDRPVYVIGFPVAPIGYRDRPPAKHIVCLGHVGVPRVRPMLERIAEAFGAAATDGAVTLSWRSNQADGRIGADNDWAYGLASLLQITLLDDVTPSAMRDTLAHADAVVVMTDSTEGWIEAVRAHAASASVPTVVPEDPDHVVSQIRRALVDRSADDAAFTQPADAVLARLIQIARGHAPRTPARLPHVSLVATHASTELVTETCQ
ncbi:MAG: glycosyltransferase [Vicinamibacterales bacterium]